jgi:hypothetical protein
MKKTALHKDNILSTAKNLRIDEQDCGLIFFDPINRRYEYRESSYFDINVYV